LTINKKSIITTKFQNDEIQCGNWLKNFLDDNKLRASKKIRNARNKLAAVSKFSKVIPKNSLNSSSESEHEMTEKESSLETFTEKQNDFQVNNKKSKFNLINYGRNVAIGNVRSSSACLLS